MCDLETFLTTLYVIVDDFCQTLPPARTCGPAPALSRSEVLTLALLARWRRFASEREFYRWAQQQLRPAFPHLPHRTQFNRQVRRQQVALEQLAGFLLAQLPTAPVAFEALDRVGVPTRNYKRRGRGWLAGQADIGPSNRLGWFHGFGVLLSTQPHGGITGWGIGPASAKDQALAETFFAARQAGTQGPPCSRDPAHPGTPPVCLFSVGAPADRVYLADRGFHGRHTHRRWKAHYGAEVIAPPQGNQVAPTYPWPRGLRKVVAGLRQIVETVIAKLDDVFGLRAERPHTLGGFAARFAARAALHNFCLGWNQRHQRPALAFADLIDWP
jgi:hypothetical protein